MSNVNNLTHLCVILCLFYCFGLKSKNYDVVLKGVYRCQNPDPPYSKKQYMNILSEIHTHKGITYIKGNVSVKEPMPFRNFNGRTFMVNSTGHRVLKFEIKGVTCRNFIASMVLKYSNIIFTKNNCSVLKGFYPYNIDLTKASHVLPVWHDQGQVIHQLQLVVNGATDSCQEIVVENKARH